MRTAWNMASFLAVIHLLALIAFVGWLWQSGRLSSDRVQRVRAMLAMTITEENDQMLQAAASAEQVRLDAVAAGRREHPPLPAAAHNEAVNSLREQQQRTIDRLDDEKNLLLAQLDRVSGEYKSAQANFLEQQRSWYASVESERKRKEDEQFKQALKLYESIPAKQARDMLLKLVEDGDTNQAVAYLDSMNTRAAAKILREFKSEPQTQLAKDLLEELRLFGVIDAGPQDEPDERAVAIAPGASKPTQR